MANNSAFSVRSLSDGVVSGASFQSGILLLNRTQGLSDISIDLSVLSGSSSLTFNNGLTETGGTVSLGGALTGDTVIDTNSNGLAIGRFASAEGSNSVAIGGYANTTTGGTNSVALASGAAQGRSSVGISYGIACGCGSFAHGRTAVGRYSVALASGCAVGNYSLAVGNRSASVGDYSVAMGGKFIRAVGNSSFNFSLNSSNSNPNSFGSLAESSAILGGRDHNIESGNTNASIIGGNSINLTGSTYIDTTAVSKLAIMNSPSTGTSGDTILVRDSSTGIIRQVTQSSLGGGGGASTLAELNDTTLGTPTDGEVIRFSSGSTTWENVNLYANLTDQYHTKYDEASKSLRDSVQRDRISPYINCGYSLQTNNFTVHNGTGNSGFTNAYAYSTNFKQYVGFTNYGKCAANYGAGINDACITILALNQYDSNRGGVINANIKFRWIDYGGGFYQTNFLNTPTINKYGGYNITPYVSKNGNGKVFIGLCGTANSAYRICGHVENKSLVGNISGGA